jgi:hypothetical protein
MRSIGVALLFAFCSVSTACVHKPVPAEDEWLRVAPRQLFAEATLVAAADVRPVAETQLSYASLRLGTVPAVVLSEADAVQLIGSPVEPVAGYVLVRGLCVGCGTGKFYVYGNDSYLIVSHVSLASAGTPATRWPVVLKLAELPADVYVQYSAFQ